MQDSQGVEPWCVRRTVARSIRAGVIGPGYPAQTDLSDGWDYSSHTR